MIIFKIFGNTFHFASIFSKQFSRIKLSRILQNKQRYFIVEIKEDKLFLSNYHFPHAISLSKLNLEELKNIVDHKNNIVINCSNPNCYLYFHKLKKMGYKKVYILLWK